MGGDLNPPSANVQPKVTSFEIITVLYPCTELYPSTAMFILEEQLQELLTILPYSNNNN